MDQVQAPEAPAQVDWTRWMPGISPSAPSRWRLIRFEHMDAAGRPLGEPLVSMTPQGAERLFPNVLRAEWAAAELNRLEGR